MARVETDTMQDRLCQATYEASALLGVLQPLMAEPDGSGPDTGTIGRHAPESREPWSMQVAGAYWDIYFGAREVHRALRYLAGLHLHHIDDVCGADALDMIRNLAPGASDFALRGATHTLEKLVRRARSVPDIDDGEPWAPLPNQPGHAPLACPYCNTYGLRMLRRKGEVRCFFPDCVDSDGHPTRARMEPGRMTGEGRLVFGDGTTMGGGE
jgi:hypothetical protein